MKGDIQDRPSTIASLETHWVRSIYEQPLEACERILGMRPLVERELTAARENGTDGGKLSYLEAPFLSGMKVYPSVWKPYINAVMARATGKTETLVKLRIQFSLTLLPILIKYLYGLKGAFWSICDKPLVQLILVSRRVDNSIDILEKATGKMMAESWMREMFVDEGHWTKKSRRTKVGAQIDIHPGDDSLRGYHGARISLGGGRYFITPVIVIFEEAAFIKNLDYVLKEIVLQYQGAEVLMTSSPYGKLGPIWDAWQGESSVKFENFGASQLQNPMLPRAKVLATLKRLIALGQQNVALQEILGLFASDSGLFIPNVVWLRAVNHDLDYWDLEEFKNSPGRILGRFTLGIDPNGGSSDERAHPVGMGLIQHHPNGKHQLRWRLKDHISIERVVEIAQILDNKVSLERINTDSGYGAAYPVLLGNAGVKAKVELIPNSASRQAAYMTKARDLMALGWMEMPYDPVLNSEQQSLTSALLGGDRDGLGLDLSTLGKSTRLPDCLNAIGLAVDQEVARSIHAPGTVGFSFGRREPEAVAAVMRSRTSHGVRPSMTSVGVRR
jgi:hypothetical protein